MVQLRQRMKFLADQARKTINRPTRVFVIVRRILHQWFAPIISRALARIKKSLPSHRGRRGVGLSQCNTAISAPSPRSEREIQANFREGLPLGELQSNNCYLNKYLSPDLTELAKRHTDRRIDIFVFDTRLVERQNLALARRLLTFFQNTNTYREIELDDIVACIARYREVYLAAPITQNLYGLNFPSGLCLFVMARCLAPRLIVESGVYKGLSSYILASACPTATIHAFDPNLKELSFRPPGVTYYEHDWMNTEIRCDHVSGGLGFFDDHQSQAMRIVQAHERGFRYLIFDDSWPVETAIGCGWPPLPSVDMVTDSPLAPGEAIRWMEGNQLWTYVHTDELHALCTLARKLIRAAYEIPSLYRQSGIGPSSALKFVELA